jgi:hypothetical protein
MRVGSHRQRYLSAPPAPIGFFLFLSFAIADADALEPPATPSPFFVEAEPLLLPFVVVEFFPLSFLHNSR